ncbi:DNA polymerase eta [Malaya genurostris]|uniref:DNA polymerase eta n=1 Tax=Malaya genurostris TaxID=325434 RepID=UPI0026F3C4B8|nr:DNA polymerase eta [Malaya genurostris]
MSKQYININHKYDRIIVLVDMDCFYCQVEEKLNPQIRGNPIAVVQYNPWQGGGIIAVNYAARAKGVTRHMRGDEARKHCPEIVLMQVPQIRGKADINKYREAGKEVADVLKTFTPLLERASVDEAYMDITKLVLSRLRDMNEGKYQIVPEKLADTFAVGYDSIGDFVKKISYDLEGPNEVEEMENVEEHVVNRKSDIKLLIGASIVNEIRTVVKNKTGFECSAGIAHNKILAKLTAGFHKPNRQTILPLKSIAKMYQTLPIKKIKGLGGKLGDQVCEVLKVQYMSELAKFPEKLLQCNFDERIGSWMFLIAKGIDLEAVTPKFNSKSIGCCKRFPGKNAIGGVATLKHWLSELAAEIQERLEKDMNENNRIAKQITVSYTQQVNDNDVSSTRSVPLVAYDAEKITTDALETIRRNSVTFFKSGSSSALNNPITFLGISAGKFDSFPGKGNGLKEMFSNMSGKVAQENLKEPEMPPEQKHVLKTDSQGDPKKSGNTSVCDTVLNSNITSLNDSVNKSKVQVQLQQVFEIEETVNESTYSCLPSSSRPEQVNYVPSSSSISEIKHVISKMNDKGKISDLNDQVAPVDYHNTYAEYYQAVALIQCTECKTNIPENEMQSHRDFHLALQLSQKQREDFRNELKQKKILPEVKSKTSTTAKLTQFLKQQVTGNSITPTERCTECGKFIPCANLSEHTDYHTARKLQFELNQTDMKKIVPIGQPCQPSNTIKRKRSKSKEQNPQLSKIKNLTSYFNKIP